MPELGSLLSVQEASNDLIGDRSRPASSGSIFKSDTGNPVSRTESVSISQNSGYETPILCLTATSKVKNG